MFLVSTLAILPRPKHWRRAAAVLMLLFAGSVGAFSEALTAANGTVLSRESYKTTLSYEEWFQKAFGPGSRSPHDPPTDQAQARAYFSPRCTSLSMEQAM